MSIEFQCTRCHSVLRVPDEIAGRKAQCPYCEEIQLVPVSHSAGSDGDVPPPMEPQPIPSGTVPPSMPIPPDYRSGGFELPFPDPGPQFVPPAATLVPNRVEFSELFQRTWDVFFNRIADFLLIGLVTCGLTVLVGGILVVFQLGTGLVIDFENVQIEDLTPPRIIATIIVNLISSLVQAYLFIGGVRYSIHLVRGGETRLELMFPNFLVAVYYFVTSLLLVLILLSCAAVAALLGGGVSLLVTHIMDLMNVNFPLGFFEMFIIGFIVLYAAIAIYVNIRFMLTVCFIADRREGPMQALQSSFAYTANNGLTLFAAIIVYSIISVFVILCTCYTGIIFAVPLIECFTAVAYLMLTGQLPGLVPQQYGFSEPRP